MRIKKLTATFGRLEGETLTLEDGLNVITAPNEGGKSTWCALLRAMLYGVPTRERDTRTTLAEKNRYQPWSGSPMAGEADLTWNGREITLRRFQKGSSPFGGFEAVYTGTSEPVEGLTGDNCGEVLLGVPREVFERSAFVGQGSLAVTQTGELEKRIAALVSSGEEDVSFSETEKTLKGWLNRRRHNRTGLIPKLEEEAQTLAGNLARVRETTRRITDAEGEREELEGQRRALEAEAAAQKARQDWARAEQYRGAVAELDAAQKALRELEREQIPSQEALRQAQGELVYFNTITANLKQAKNELEPARQAVDEAGRAAADPVFEGLSPDEAWRQAGRDAERARPPERSGSLPLRAAGFIFLLAALVFAAAAGLGQNPLLAGAAGLELLAGVLLLAAGGRKERARRAERQAVLDRYGVRSPDDILARANRFRDRWGAVEERRRQAEAVETSIAALTAQREELWARLLAFVRPFAPAVTDLFGVSAALSRALSLDERRATARVKVEAAQRLVSSIPAPAPPAAGPAEGAVPPPVERPAAETAALLSAVRARLSQVEAALAMARGERGALGDPDELEARRQEVEETLLLRREEYEALTVALEALAQANAQLQARFSPELNRRAGEIFAALTGGRYEDITLTRELEASARPAGEVLPRRAMTLSQGTVDQLYLAVRLAVCDMALPGQDPAPLILDDALVTFDDARLGLALEFLRDLARRRQVLLFTCQGREEACLAPQTAGPLEGRV